MTKEYYHIDDFNVGEELLAILVEEEILSESVSRGFLSKAMILEENEAPVFHTFKDGSKVSWDTFYSIYTDYDQFPTHEMVFEGMGLEPMMYKPENADDLSPHELRTKIRESCKKALDNAVARFQKKGFNGLYPPSQRKNYSKRLREQIAREDFYDQMADDPDNPFGQPTYRDIIPGKKGQNRGKDGRIINQINNSEIIRGELYNNFTRIPKSRWGSWLNFFKKEYASVSSGNKIWKKQFILGYQVEQNVFYEIWYNSINSTFSVHDSRGNEISNRFTVLNEALKQLLSAVAKFSRDDAMFFLNSNNNLSRSFMNSVKSGVDQRVKELAAIEAKEIQKFEKAEEDFVKESEEKRQSIVKQGLARLREKGNLMARIAKDRTISGVKSGASAAGREAREILTGARRREEEEARKAEREREIRDTWGEKDSATSDAFAKRREERQARATARIRREMEDDLFGRAARQREELVTNPHRAIDDDIQRQLRDKQELSKAEKELAKLKRELKMSQAANKGMFSDEVEKETRVRQRTEESKDAQSKKAALKRSEERVKKLKAFIEKQKNRQGNLFEGEDYGVAPELNFEEYLDSYVLTEEEEFEFDAMEDAIDDVVDTGTYDSIVKSFRNQANKDSLSGAFIKGTIAENMVTRYDETRVDKTFGQRGLRRFLLSRNRKPIILPTDKPSIWNRIKGFFRGVRYRADFISGYTYSDKVNIEIWYITEPNPDKDWKKDDRKPQTISTFYVFDVTAGVLVRKYIPYYRNALQIAVAKLSAF